MTSSTFIRLAGPLQSWAALAVSGNFIRTKSAPTLSGLQGLLAGALGAKRNDWPEWIYEVRFTVREDRKAQYTDDFQTIGIREDEWDFRSRLAIMQLMRKPKTASELALKPAVGSTAISRRTYLRDAEFIVRVTHERYAEEIDCALSSPEFSLYLGKKAFPATFPFYLGTGPSDLLSLIPVIVPGEKEKGSVTVLEMLPGLTMSPFMEWVPVVSDRSAWLRRLQSLNLQKRTTVRY